MSKVLGSLGEAPFRSVVNVNLDATLPSCKVRKVRRSSNRSVAEPSTVKHKLSTVSDQSILLASGKIFVYHWLICLFGIVTISTSAAFALIPWLACLLSRHKETQEQVAFFSFFPFGKQKSRVQHNCAPCTINWVKWQRYSPAHSRLSWTNALKIYRALPGGLFSIVTSWRLPKYAQVI